jgi:GNAT superfamily N-acetyltransferase
MIRVTSEDIQRDGAEAHLVAHAGDDAVVARASLWWSATPPLDGKKLGAIGHFTAMGEEAARVILDAACQRLTAEGCAVAVGPMDGNTWRRYRWLTERGEEAVFLMEPDNPDEWPGHWQDAGFAPLATYFSALNDNLAFEDAQVARAGERLRRAGVTVRPLDPARFDEELRRIYAVSLRAFPSNYLYTPLPEAAFLTQYQSVRDRIRPELVLLAELHGEAVGYVFAIPDWLRGPATDTAIIKTVAVVPGRVVAGLGTWLVALAQIAARELGFRRVIHALMHESNNSLNLSARYARRMRRYTLYSRTL